MLDTTDHRASYDFDLLSVALRKPTHALGTMVADLDCKDTRR